MISIQFRYFLPQLVFSLLISSTSVVTPAFSASMSVDDIVRKTEYMSYFQGSDGKARVKMTITDSQGRERKRRFSILRRDQEADDKAGSGGDQKYFVHINYPSDLKNTVLLVWKHPGSLDDRWLYLSALDLAKRIAASDKRTSFLGSDFFYEDISGRSLNEDTHKLVETSDRYYVVKSVPKKPDAVEFSEYTMWIHRKSFLPIKAEFLDKQGQKHRTYTALKVDDIQGHPTVTQSKMQDFKLKQETVLEFSNIKYDTDIPESIFTERYLRNPPRGLLR